MRNSVFPVFVKVISGMLLLCVFMLGYNKGESNTKEEAIRIGVAYYTNNVSGKSQFKWKEAKP